MILAFTASPSLNPLRAFETSRFLSFEIWDQYSVHATARGRTYLGLVAETTELTSVNLEEETVVFDFLD
jgi:hypothetical protein